MTVTRVGMLTIGQAPRADGMAAEISAVLGPAFEVVERGALDRLELDEIARLAPGPADILLVTLLADGREVHLAKAAILPLLQRQISALEDDDGVAATLLVCGGPFPGFRRRRPLIQPQKLLYGAALALAGEGRVAIMLPDPNQVGWAREQWRAAGVADPLLLWADPYQPDRLARVTAAAGEAAAAGAACLYMDCFGYDLALRDAAAAAFKGPIVLARTTAGRLLAEVAS